MTEHAELFRRVDVLERNHAKAEQRIVQLERRTDVIHNVLDNISRTLNSLESKLSTDMKNLTNKVDLLTSFNNRLVGAILLLGGVMTALGFVLKPIIEKFLF